MLGLRVNGGGMSHNANLLAHGGDYDPALPLQEICRPSEVIIMSPPSQQTAAGPITKKI